MVTIKDISKMANVSIATVSKVLNGNYTGVGEKTKERILRIAKETNYRPNRLARGLVMNHTNIIGLIVSDITNPFFAALAKGVEDKADSCGYNVILCNTDENPKKEMAYSDVLCQYSVDGVIVTGSGIPNHDHILGFRRYNIPFVSIDRFLDDDTYSVFVDNFRGAYMATEHVIKKGHKEIAFIGGDFQMTQIPNQRLNGYLQAIRDYGLERIDNLIKIGSYHTNSGYESIKQLLQDGSKFSAVVCGNDLIAFGVMKGLKENGIRVPDDVSIIGYDDIYLASLIEPNLTTIRQPVYEMGSYAVDLLIRLIKEGSVNEKTRFFGPQLIARDSVRNLNKSII